MFGYFGSFFGRERLGSRTTTLLAPEPSKGDGMRVFDRIRCRGGRNGFLYDITRRNVDDTFS
jgi:hypothetical protein